MFGVLVFKKMTWSMSCKMFVSVALLKNNYYAYREGTRQVNIKTKRVCNFVPKINKLKPLFFALIWALVSHLAQILLFFERKLEPSPSVAKSELLSFACFFRLLSEFKAPFVSTILARYGHRYSSSFFSLFIVCLFGR